MAKWVFYPIFLFMGWNYCCSVVIGLKARLFYRAIFLSKPYTDSNMREILD
jgi:hypothetical protein